MPRSTASSRRARPPRRDHRPGPGTSTPDVGTGTVPTDSSGRPLRLRDVDLDVFFHPRTIAVIGASEQSARPNSAMTRKFAAWAARNGATFYPVHPRYETVLGHRVYPSVFDVPGDLDLAVILTGAAVDTFEEVLARKARFAVIFAAGFSETGPAGARLERRLAELVASGEVRLLGPNTNLNAFEDFRDDLGGPGIALITQSGHQGRPVFQGQELGIRLTHWAPTGNEVDLEFADFCRYFAEQPEVGVIACYVEGFKDGRTLQLAADHAARRRVPVVMVKVGRTEAGASMAQSHTGHLTGSDRVTSAVLRQFGVHRVDGLDELLDTSMALARTRTDEPPAWARAGREPGVVIYAISGGTGAHMADMAAAAGLRLPTLRRETQRLLHDGLIPRYLRVSNPVDCGGPPVADARGRRILDAILADDRCDVLVVPITGAVPAFSDPFTSDLVEVGATTTKPIFVVWGAPPGTDDTYFRRLLDGGLPTFRTFGNCVRAVRAYRDTWTFFGRYRSPFDAAPRRPRAGAARVRRLLAGGPGPRSEVVSKQALAAYGIRPTRDTLAGSVTDAVRAARALGRPCVLKVAAAGIPHKSDLGLVRVGVAPSAVRTTYDELLRRARRVAPGVEIDGVLVSELVTDGVEMLAGVSTDPLFGPVVSVGLGGVFVEVLGDVAVRVPPFDETEAGRMVRELRGFPLLAGARGRPPADVDALVEVLMDLQRFALDLGDVVAEVDVNPLVVRRRGARALDALVVCR